MIRRLLLAGQPQETRFFVFLGGFGIGLGVIYWVLTRELAGTTLLVAFGLAGGLVGLRLAVGRRRGPDAAGAADAGGPPLGAAGGDLPAGGPGGVDRPFADESGRLPGETLAPLAVGVGVGFAVTAIVFGPWLLVAGVVPLAWGAWTWLSGARDELDAVETGSSSVAAAARRETADSAASAAPPHPVRPPS